MSSTRVTDESDETTDESTRSPPVAPHDDAVVGEPVIDRQPGSGSLSKQEAWTSQAAQSRQSSNDGRYGTRTTFYYTGSSDDPRHLQDRDRHQLHRDPADRRGWSELSKWNDGMRDIDGSRKQQNFDADVRRWVQTFAKQLDCNETQVAQVEHVVTNELDLGNFGDISAEKVILSTISLVVDASTTIDPDDFDLDNWIIYRDAFEEMMDAVDMDRDELWTVRKKVHDTADFFATE